MRCDNCGAEIFAGQRFCRSCGRPTEKHPEENVPTQMMPPQGGQQRSHADTAPPVNPYTNPVYHPPGYYQPIAPVSPAPAYNPPRTRSGWVWIVAMIGVVVLSFMAMGFFIVARSRQSPGRRLEPPPGSTTSAGAAGLSRANAKESSRATSLEPITFALSANSTVTVQNVNGDISVEGWDRPEAQVAVTLRGGSINARRAVEVIPSTDGGNLMLRSSSGGDNIAVDYVIKLPRKLAAIALEAVNSEITLSEVGGGVSINNVNGEVNISRVKGNVTVTTKNSSVDVSRITGDVSISVGNGEIQMSDVEGAVEARTLNGDLSAVFDSVVPGKPLKFSTVSGDVELEIKSEIDADLKAQTKSGDIDIAEVFGIGVEKQLVGQKASGQLGKGGLPLTVETVSGDISIRK